MKSLAEKTSAELRHTVATNLRRVRKAREMTQAEVAELCNVATTYVCSIENSKVNATLSTIARLCVALDVSPEEILVPQEGVEYCEVGGED